MRLLADGSPFAMRPGSRSRSLKRAWRPFRRALYVNRILFEKEITIRQTENGPQSDDTGTISELYIQYLAEMSLANP